MDEIRTNIIIVGVLAHRKTQGESTPRLMATWDRVSCAVWIRQWRCLREAPFRHSPSHTTSMRLRRAVVRSPGSRFLYDSAIRREHASISPHGKPYA